MTWAAYEWYRPYVVRWARAIKRDPIQIERALYILARDVEPSTVPRPWSRYAEVMMSNPAVPNP